MKPENQYDDQAFLINMLKWREVSTAWKVQENGKHYKAIYLILKIKSIGFRLWLWLAL